jgi:hypothetical protein
VIIGHKPEAIVLRSDAQGRIAFPLRLDLVDANPEVRVISSITAHPALSFTGTFSFKCDERGITKGTDREWIRTEAFAKMVHQDFGPDRVYADGSGVTRAHVRAMGEHLVRLRAGYHEVTGWDPPSLRVLLRVNAHTISTEADADGVGVWPITPAEIEARERTTAFLAHEWTHAALAQHTSGAGELGQRWLEDGLCELVAYHVEKRLFPELEATTLHSRAAELAAGADVPQSVALLEFGTSDAKSVFGHLAAQCDNGRLFGYAYAFAFWHAAVRDEAALRKIMAKLDSEILVTVAREAAPPAFAALALERTCAQAVLAGDPSCASAAKP